MISFANDTAILFEGKNWNATHAKTLSGLFKINNIIMIIRSIVCQKLIFVLSIKATNSPKINKTLLHNSSSNKTL